jgi:hypothetical protein
VLDVLKPHEPPIHDVASKLAVLSGIDHVNVSLGEIDQSTETVKIAIEGPEVNLNSIKKHLEDLGAVIHSIDEVTVGKKEPVKEVKKH